MNKYTFSEYFSILKYLSVFILLILRRRFHQCQIQIMKMKVYRRHFQVIIKTFNNLDIVIKHLIFIVKDTIVHNLKS